MNIEEPRASSFQIFYSYAHNDESMRNKLHHHLSLLRQQGFIAEWYDRDINAGIDWKDQIDVHLNAAHIILLLISADFIASEYCYGTEMKKALTRHQSGSARVIPILLRPSDWETAPFAHLQVLPKNAQPITTWENEDLAYTEIALALRAFIKPDKNEAPNQTNSVVNNNLRIDLDSDSDQQANAPQRKENGTKGIYISADILNALESLSSCQKKVSELKSVHNMLHEIEQQLIGLTPTIQIPLLINEYLMNDPKEVVSPSKRFFLKKEIKKKETNQFHINIISIEYMWQHVRQKINDLAFFAAEEMSALLPEDERLIFKSSGIQGPSWIKDLLALQKNFEASMKERHVTEMDKYSQDLLEACRSHLYMIDRRLLIAVREVSFVSDNVLRSVQ